MRVTRKEVERLCKAYGLRLERRTTDEMRLYGTPRWIITSIRGYFIQPQEVNEWKSNLQMGLRIATSGKVLNCKSLEQCKQAIKELLQEALDWAAQGVRNSMEIQLEGMYRSHYWHPESLESFRKKHAHRAEVRALEKAVPVVNVTAKPKTRRL